MAWLQTLHHFFNPAKIERVAHTIAAENHHVVLQRIVDRGVGMRGAEAKGYIRSRAAQVVTQAVDEYLTSEKVSSKHVRRQLVEQTTAALVVNLMPELIHRESVQRVAA